MAHVDERKIFSDIDDNEVTQHHFPYVQYMYNVTVHISLTNFLAAQTEVIPSKYTGKCDHGHSQ